VRWLILAGLIGFALWHWAGATVRMEETLTGLLNVRTATGPCALLLEEIRARMIYHGTLVAYCDDTGWKFPRGRRVCRLWARR